VAFVLDFDSRNGILRVTLEGVITDAILLEAYTVVGSYVASRGPCRAIVDVSGVTKFNVASRTVRELAKSAPAIPTGYMRVFVAPQAAIYGMMRMFQMLGELTRPDLYAARSMDEAYALLQLNSPEFTPIR